MVLKSEVGGTNQKLLLSLKVTQIAQNCYHIFIFNPKFLQDSIRIELRYTKEQELCAEQVFFINPQK